MQDEDVVEVQGRGARTRLKVLEAALEVVKERPLAEVQLQHIAARAGISAGHVLYHYGSKDQILVETLKWSEEGIAEQRAVALSRSDVPAEQLAVWIAMYLPRSSDDPTWKLWLELWMRSTMDPGLREVPSGIGARWIEDIEAILEEGSARGMFTVADRDEFVTWAHSLLAGLSLGVLVGWLDLEHAKRIAADSVGKELGCTIPVG